MSGRSKSSSRSATAELSKLWVDTNRRDEAKEVFTRHTKETSNLDVLTRCKKLNELLSSDVLKGKGGSKAQLKEILGILNAGPARPSFLDDKPSITATVAAKKPSGGGGGLAGSAGAPLSYEAATFGLLGELENTGPPSAKGQADDVDDLISLLNTGGPTPEQLKAAEEAERQQREAERLKREAAEKAEKERQRRAKEAAEEAERLRKAKLAEEEAERKRVAAAAAAEALRLERHRASAATTIQAFWRGHCARRLAAQRRKQVAEQRARFEAAAVLQACWRARRSSRQHRARVAAAAALQCAVRAWRARRRLQRLQVEAFRRERAAKIIQRAFRYMTRWKLGELRVPVKGRPPSAGVDSAALLARQLRLRGAMDARCAPDQAPAGAPGSAGAGSADEGTPTHRTVAQHRERVKQVSAGERSKRNEAGERTTMAASEHREQAEALAIARQGVAVVSCASPSHAAAAAAAAAGPFGAAGIAHAPGPSSAGPAAGAGAQPSGLPPPPRSRDGPRSPAVRVPAEGGPRPLSRSGSLTASRPGSSADGGGGAALRPSSSLRRLSGSAGLPSPGLHTRTGVGPPSSPGGPGGMRGPPSSPGRARGHPTSPGAAAGARGPPSSPGLQGSARGPPSSPARPAGTRPAGVASR
ncbi:hypothetical protein HYH03_002954 [Edaphochlamys debaryana]|uniref:Uncharacterized protein n=1 Tax=Edaphochlamys debaryana TaxID=47281 RepID=A0A835YCV5_9CHLO|nr:hypothetical protein HYH03_002954 [Edaphochlamys debaryana]|eukprot:KAG2499379.1 hypothetical protein HYH03_002954 [Edaphochlamys debaryana]